MSQTKNGNPDQHALPSQKNGEHTELKANEAISLLGWHDGVMDDELYEMTFNDADGDGIQD